jgi:dTDP-D-glucose 4,6-dehydratase
MPDLANQFATQSIERKELDENLAYILGVLMVDGNLYELSSMNSEQNLRFLNTINPCIKNKKPDKLPNRKRHPEQYCLALKLKKEFGWGYKKMAKHIKMSPWTIRYWLKGY